jgi:hypothetical protein
MHEWAKEEGKEKGLDFAEAYKVMILKKEDDIPGGKTTVKSGQKP